MPPKFITIGAVVLNPALIESAQEVEVYGSKVVKIVMTSGFVFIFGENGGIEEARAFLNAPNEYIESRYWQ